MLILALIFRNGQGVGHKPPQMGRWEAQRQSCDARGWHTLCKGGGGGCHDAQKLDHCLFVCPELKFSSSISNSGFWIRNKPVCGQASPSKSKTNYICCCYMERWRVGGGLEATSAYLHATHTLKEDKKQGLPQSLHSKPVFFICILQEGCRSAVQRGRPKKRQ